MTSRNAAFHEVGIAGSLLAPVKWCFCMVILLLGMTVTAWIVDGLFVFHIWPQGLNELKNVLAQDLAHVKSLGGWDHRLDRWAVAIANSLYDMLFRLPGIHDMAERCADPVPMSVANSIVRQAYLSNYGKVQMAMISTQLLGIRLAVLLGAAPMIAVIYAAGMADGLAWRGIRRARGGHESSTIYHRAKYFAVSIGALLASLYLLLPASVDFRCLLLSWAIVLAMLARWQWTYYKKYL